MQLKAPAAKQGEQLYQQHPPAVVPRLRSWLFHTRRKGDYCNDCYLLRASCYMLEKRELQLPSLGLLAQCWGTRAAFCSGKLGVMECHHHSQSCWGTALRCASSCWVLWEEDGTGCQGKHRTGTANIAVQHPTSITWEKHQSSVTWEKHSFS